jgi:NAD(P)-dependent dehydrogenase (short-subunit alcohol dehydrogenase family)
MLLRDKVVVISGVGSGLGRALAVRSAAAGANVVLAARTEARLASVSEEVTALGREALSVPTDVNSDDACDALLQSTVERFGRVDALVNNAFAWPPMKDLLEISPDELRGSIDTNVLAALRLTRLFTPELEKTHGSVVMINSAVLRHSRRAFGAYKMAKSSLLSVAQTLATELGPRGVRVNSVAPGYIWGDNLKYYLSYLAKQRGITPEEVYTETASTVDLRKLPEPEEIADAVVFMASDLARAVTGQCLDVNGGEYHV